MHVETPRLARARRLELSPQAFRRLALASAVSLYVIVVSGAVVRLTASGLGCESWPGCEPGSFFPASNHHALVEFGNRVVALFPLTLTLLAGVGATRTPGLPRWARWTALATFLGTFVQAPLGFVTIALDLHPLLVLSHFLLALLVLAGAVLVGLEAWGLERGFAGVAPPPRALALALALVVACAALVVTGTLATAAGPHSGGPDVARLGLLVDAVRLHVRVTAVFGVVLTATLVALGVQRRRFPGLFRIALALLGLLLVQMAVGELQWRTQLPWGVVLVHVALAAAIWAVTVGLARAVHRPLASLVAART